MNEDLKSIHRQLLMIQLNQSIMLQVLSGLVVGKQRDQLFDIGKDLQKRITAVLEEMDAEND